MGFNRRKMEDQRREAAEKDAATRRATDAQALDDAERLIAAWNERQSLRAPIAPPPFAKELRLIGSSLTLKKAHASKANLIPSTEKI
jgi:hypothetical protein